ncbi:MAG TPA: hypothetical protein VNX21_01315 [Candidatus Thermoplasmatota archaeon]|nr:hypothetical protein [Candidatus Thermoplasmatota archaeon]
MVDEDQGNVSKPYSQASPDEVREQTQQKVGSFVSKAAGMMHKATDKMDQGGQKTTSAIEKTSATTRDVGKVAVEETRKTKEDLGSQGGA